MKCSSSINALGKEIIFYGIMYFFHPYNSSLIALTLEYVGDQWSLEIYIIYRINEFQ